MDEVTIKEELHRLAELIERQNLKMDKFIERTVIIEQQIKDRPTLGCIREFKSIVDEEFIARYEKMKSVHKDWHDKEETENLSKSSTTVGKWNNLVQIGVSLFPYVAIVVYFLAKHL